ncbi:nitroreductase/quinone reductase family protein [Yinghuangia sp. YIM S09857]|uniref:nitroreductase/quinone reductase family protein n=1 Tax=Yinghuangia sp. YIM S09857 TaxID=3436929 RepID=UPI003F53CF97
MTGPHMTGPHTEPGADGGRAVDGAHEDRHGDEGSLRGSGATGEGAPSDRALGENTPGGSGPGESTPGGSGPGESTPGEIGPGEGGPGDGAPGESTVGESTPGGSGPGDGAPGDPALAGNAAVIAEFRANAGRVGGFLQDADLLLLTTRGRRTGRPHTAPLGYLRDGHRLLVFGSNAGQDTHPAWFHNVGASPRVAVEVPYEDGSGIEEFTGTAIPLEGEERDRLYALQAACVPAYADYQAATQRVIPVLALLRLDFAGDPERARAAGRQLLAAHADLRAEIARLRGDAVPGDGVPSRSLAGHCLAFCSALGTHHDSEGTAFTAIEAAYPELKPTLDQLRDEHRAVVDALRTIRSLAERIALGDGVPTLRAELGTLADDLERHFAFEEAELLPALGLDATGQATAARG